MEERLKEEPNDPQTMVLLANEYRIKQDPRKAVPLYEKAIELFKDIYFSIEFFREKKAKSLRIKKIYVLLQPELRFFD